MKVWHALESATTSPNDDSDLITEFNRISSTKFSSTDSGSSWIN